MLRRKHHDGRGATPLLSVLIPSLPSRAGRFLAPLLRSLDAQIDDPAEVEVLTLMDNRRRSIGEKRNLLLDMASGRYSAFVDDDDRVEATYVSAILEAIRAQPDADVICFDVWVNGYHRLGYTPPEGMLCRYGIGFEDRNEAHMFTRRPNHLMVYRTRLARAVRFPHVSHGEDSEWARLVSARIRREARIERVLYYYDFDVDVSETPVSREWRRRAGQRPADGGAA
jgi:glycosyltransferase involved in cell wall biosynthesis